MKPEETQKFPEIPFSKLLSEKILPFGGPATLSDDQQAYEDGILLLSQEMVVLYSNKQAFDLLSTQENQLLGKQLDIPGLGEHTNLLHAVLVDNSERIIELRTNPLFVEGVHYVLAVLQDITQQFEGMQRLNFAIETTELGLWDHNFITNSTSINPYYATMLGYTFEEFESSNWINLVHPLDLDGIWESWNAHIAKQIPFYQAEYRIRTKDGKWKWVRARGQVKGRDEKGEPLHFIGSHQDITTQKQDKRELQMQYEINAISGEFIPLDQKLEKMLGRILPILFADKGMIHLNDQQDIPVVAVSINLNLKEIYAIEQISDRFLREVEREKIVLASNESSPTGQQFLDAASAQLAVVYPLNIREECLGTLTIFWTKAQPFTDLEDHIAGVAANQLAVSIERDTLRQKAEDAVLTEERQRLARELHDSLSQSLYSVMLSADGGQDFARLGQPEEAGEIFKGIKETIQQTLKEMRLLIYELHPSILVQEGLHKALQRRLEAVEKRAGLNAEFEDNLTRLPTGPVEAQLYGIAQEGLNNILKHAQANSVKIILDQQDKNIRMQIIDDGQGFDCMQNVKDGFGIANMKERARQLDGNVEIESALGQGTRITVHIPVRDQTLNVGEVDKNG
jgi:PAS domain S-box-containing protein